MSARDDKGGEDVRSGHSAATSTEVPTFEKFRKRPVVIEARQWKGDNWPDFLLFIVARGGMATTEGDLLVIDTLEGAMTASPGDWIIRGVRSEFYPCKPEIFEETYERVD